MHDLLISIIHVSLSSNARDINVHYQIVKLLEGVIMYFFHNVNLEPC